MKVVDASGAEVNGGLKVWLGNQKSLGSQSPENSIFIAAVNDGWNDFGIQTLVKFKVRVQEGVPIEARGYFGFVDSKSTAGQGNDWISKKLAENNKSKVLLGGDAPFFTMLPDMESYRKMVSELGAADAVSVLLAIHDLVALTEFDQRRELLEAAQKTEVFGRSFMRNSGAYFAVKNAGPILRGLDSERTGVLSQSLSINFQLAAFPNEHRLSFDFDHDGDLPKRMAVIIGKNGVGKSQALGRIAKAALRGSESLTDGAAGGRPLINRLLAFAPTNEASSVFPRATGENPRIWYRRYSLNRSRARSDGDRVSDLIVQAARSEQSIGTRTRWEIFSSALSAIGESGQLSLVSSHDSSQYVSFSSLNSGPEQKRLDRFASIDLSKDPVRVIDGKGYALSSGELSFVKFCAQVSTSVENGTLLLLDEPETHLHPNFVNRFVYLLDTLLELTGSSAIIATHSAFLVREVFREQVTILGVDEDGFVNSSRPTLKTFGADVGAISCFVFGEDMPSRLARQVKRKLIGGKKGWEEIYEKYKGELSLEVLADVRAQLEERDAK